MKSWKVFASISRYLIGEERWNIKKLSPSQRRTSEPWANMLPNINKCKNGSMVDFSASFRVVALKLTELIRFALPNQWFLLYLTCDFTVIDVIMNYGFLCVELASILPLVYILCKPVPQAPNCMDTMYQYLPWPPRSNRRFELLPTWARSGTK